MGKTSGKYVNETKKLEDGQILVHKYSIISTDFIVYEALRRTPPSDNGKGLGDFNPKYGYGGSTISSFDGIWFFRIGTNDLPEEIHKIRPGKERSEACRKFFQEKYDEAYKYILEAYPEAAEGKRDDGRIDVIEK